MKVRIKEIKSECTLSIGMIVKNEEKHLEKCLSALKPLLEAVDSELIIVDTGSTDKTIEIAQQFNAQIHHFDWADDFSAARNFGLEKCVGEWFMYLDADEIFDDLSELIEFFKDKAALLKYGSGYFNRKDYSDPEGAEWSSSIVERIIKRFQGLHFVNSVNEEFSARHLPIKYFKTFVHHWGYVNETEEQRKERVKNTVITKELISEIIKNEFLREAASKTAPNVTAVPIAQKTVKNDADIIALVNACDAIMKTENFMGAANLIRESCQALQSEQIAKIDKMLQERLGDDYIIISNCPPYKEVLKTIS